MRYILKLYITYCTPIIILLFLGSYPFKENWLFGVYICIAFTLFFLAPINITIALLLKKTGVNKWFIQNSFGRIVYSVTPFALFCICDRIFKYYEISSAEYLIFEVYGLFYIIIIMYGIITHKWRKQK